MAACLETSSMDNQELILLNISSFRSYSLFSVDIVKKEGGKKSKQKASW